MKRSIYWRLIAAHLAWFAFTVAAASGADFDVAYQGRGDAKKLVGNYWQGVAYESYCQRYDDEEGRWRNVGIEAFLTWYPGLQDVPLSHSWPAPDEGEPPYRIKTLVRRGQIYYVPHEDYPNVRVEKKTARWRSYVYVYPGTTKKTVAVVIKGKVQ